MTSNFSAARYRFGDVFRVEFPFVDKAEVKFRPAVVVSSDLYHRNRPDALVMALSSRLYSALELGEFEIEDIQSAGLTQPTRVKAVIATATATRLKDKIGSFSSADVEKLKHLLSRMFTS